MKYCFLVVVTALMISACQERAKPDNVTSLPAGDSTFLSLKDTAQAHLKMFIDSLAAHHADTNYRFIIKSDFLDGEKHEHMWSTIIGYEDDKFSGQFSDSAYYLKNIHPGDPVRVSRKDVEDWAMFDYKRDITIGNYSEKYLKSKM